MFYKVSTFMPSQVLKSLKVVAHIWVVSEMFRKYFKKAFASQGSNKRCTHCIWSVSKYDNTLRILTFSVTHLYASYFTFHLLV